jgi:hypothetical protein
MSDRSWFFASNGQQQGPYPDAQFRDLIARGSITTQTLVWCEGMAGWQKAGDVPGLVSGAGAPPPLVSQGGDRVTSAGGYGGGTLSVDLPVWSLFGRVLLLVIGNLVVIPSPWIVTSYYRWLTPRIHVPGRPNLGFTGQVGDIWYVIVGLALSGLIAHYNNTVQLITIVAQAFLSWMILRWYIGHLSSNGQPLPVRFNGSVWGFVGFQLLTFIAFITIIGWAWVMTAWTRWICRNIGGTHREIVFNGTGWQVLWRTIVSVLLSILIIPIPWVFRWYTVWFTEQFSLVERGAYARA